MFKLNLTCMENVFKVLYTSVTVAVYFSKIHVFYKAVKARDQSAAPFSHGTLVLYPLSHLTATGCF